MTRALVLRPEPGNARTAARLAAMGIEATRAPLFAVAPLAWAPPDPTRFDALMLTSANAVRHAGPGLERLRHLPVIAVGQATAEAAARAGLSVAFTGGNGVDDVTATARVRGYGTILHLAGRDRVASAGVTAIDVYASDALPIASGAALHWHDHVALLHSARAASRFTALIERDGADRACIAVAAISPAVLDAAGGGWAFAEAAAAPVDAVLLALVAALIDRPVVAADKRPR